jgi:RNA polymerase primary sigma factor
MSDENAVDTNKITQEQAVAEYGKLVSFIARKYCKYGMDVEDLTQEGQLGLLHAVSVFNPSRGVPFGAIAGTWIRCYIRKALSRHSKTIRIPANTRCNLIRVRNARLTLKEKLGHNPTDLEVSNFLHLTEKVVQGTKFADIRTLSIHNPLGEDGGDFQDVIPDDRPTPAQLLSDRETYERLETVVNALPLRERMVIQQRYSGTPVTLDQIGALIGKTYQRAGQIEAEALKRLKSMMRDELPTDRY